MERSTHSDSDDNQYNIIKTAIINIAIISIMIIIIFYIILDCFSVDWTIINIDARVLFT